MSTVSLFNGIKAARGSLKRPGRHLTGRLLQRLGVGAKAGKYAFGLVQTKSVLARRQSELAKSDAGAAF